MGPMTEKEKTLLAGCVKGDKAAWDALVLQYSKLAYSTIKKTLTLHHTLPQDDIVEDLHQEFFSLAICTFTEVFRRSKLLQSSKPLSVPCTRRRAAYWIN